MVPMPAEGESPVRVLVVEDEALIRLLIAEAMREAGFTVIEATNAEEALTYIDAGGAVDLVFTDITMPGAMNGLSLARQVNTRNPPIPVIITSANLGPNPGGLPGIFVQKPYSLDRVVALVQATLGLDP